MTGQPPHQDNPLTDAEALNLLTQLRQKTGSWVDWGKRCRRLQNAGYTVETLFEETGIEPGYQNLLIVAAQVYESLEKENAPEDLLAYCRGPRSDILYEFRVLNQKQRLAAVQLAQAKQLDVDEAHEVARAMKDFSRYSTPPEGFTHHPGDAVAYQCWKRARAKKDLQARSRLIAQGLKFANSPTARAKIEQLLSDFTVVSMERAPLLPFFRLEAEDELPRIIPVAGSFPLTPEQVEAVAPLQETEPFRIVQFDTATQCLPIPGWSMVLKAADPVAILCDTDELPNTSGGQKESVVVVVDRQQREWNGQSYFLVAQQDRVEVQWFPESPQFPILGQVIVVLRPKKILDEGNITEPWQMDD
ncbi:hypothetical protein PN462_09775 [Spirulina sp. CS-785/01]|uniref:RuBisCO accumulation factor 1 n=1 Tax=Spirulina sp. CS-785/01 TaxID=3021716 RepID=UPI002330CE2C|nr:RuBisCO accumulation factor 1 [Spirulina sp. CS-785/01]MDB9313385.1 hypothetical protein [Spirulina sp. CS-785/01]